ncbi:MAG: hypothetical protein DRP68_02710 [Candidatus Omnitrophota bacterium]|nr:MAG: hypothetical protein DRP68_02710 [Candidatus Omnitrophota bacterium]
MRAYLNEKTGRWEPKDGICMCHRDMYEFMVIGLINKRNKKEGRPLFTKEEVEELYRKETKEIWRKIEKGC